MRSRVIHQGFTHQYFGLCGAHTHTAGMLSSRGIQQSPQSTHIIECLYTFGKQNLVNGFACLLKYSSFNPQKIIGKSYQFHVYTQIKGSNVSLVAPIIPVGFSSPSALYSHVMTNGCHTVCMFNHPSVDHISVKIISVLLTI